MRDVYADLGVVPVINAAGTLTRFGGSVMPPEVMAAMAEASRSFVEMEELHLAAGRRISRALGVEAAHVCAGAAAGITLMTAACMTGVDRAKIGQLPARDGLAYQVVVQRAHRNAFDQSVLLAGGEFVEIEADATVLRHLLQTSVGRIAAISYTSAWFSTGAALPLRQVAEYARVAGVPVIVDAAAEIPPLEMPRRLLAEGADLVTVSGGKALRGPQASGVVLGRPDLVEACRLNDNPHTGVGRPMKAGKEEIVGLVTAIERYIATDHLAEEVEWERRLVHVRDAVSDLPGVRAWRQMPHGRGQQIPHVAIVWDRGVLPLDPEEAVRHLLAGRPRVAVQLVSAERAAPGADTEVRVHPHTMAPGDEIIVAARLHAVLEGARSSF